MNFEKFMQSITFPELIFNNFSHTLSISVTLPNSSYVASDFENRADKMGPDDMAKFSFSLSS